MHMPNNNDTIARVDEHHVSLYGKDGEFGIVHKVAIIWRSYVWVLCGASGIAGYFTKYLADHIWK